MQHRAMKPTIFLFDIDQTLIRTGGAGSRAMDRTFGRLYGLERAFAGIEFAGRTDGAILRECYTRHELHDRDLILEFARFREAYLLDLTDEMPASVCEVLPGVVPLLDALAARPDIALGLGTGNYRDAAEIKLRHVALWDRFLDGGFADDSEQRAEVIGAALRRTRAAAGLNEAGVDAWIIGDSPHDVHAAKANGLRVVGVATGHSSPADLLAAGADIAFVDLSDTEAFLKATLRGPHLSPNPLLLPPHV
ncbi:MAG: HAD family hydrolase [Dehalococcoidia bacterium]